MAHQSPVAELSARELSMLLSRLRQNILHPTAEDERRLRASQYERARVETNLSFARSALEKLERSGRTELAAERETLELLLDRMEDYNKELATDYFYDEGSSEEDLVGAIATPSESQDSRRSSETPAVTTALGVEDGAETTQTTQGLRARGEAPVVAHSTAHSTAREALFAGRGTTSSSSSTAPTAATTRTAEAILDQQREEQDAIVESIRRMATALKTSSQGFAASLEADRDRLDAAGASMEKSGEGMEAARGRMGTLRRMTEGEGWWGRMMLYAWVYGLMVVLLLVVFVLPKLRF